MSRMIRSAVATCPSSPAIEVLHNQFPGRMLTLEEPGDVVARYLSELGPPLEGQDASVRAYGS